MEAAKKKKLRSARVIATNIFMALSVVAIAGILTLFAMGYSLTKDGNLEQSGLLQVKSRPSGASVEIDGENQGQFSRTEMSKMLSGGEHHLAVTKSGYDTWQSTINIENGLLTRIDWVRLFPLQKTIETVKTYPNLRLLSASPDKHYLVILENNSAIFQLIDIRSDDVKYSTLDLSAFLIPKESEESEIPIAPVGQLEIIRWNQNNNKFLLKRTQDTTVEWILVDTQKPENSTNLTQEFLLNFDQLQFADADAAKIWTTESGNLRLIHTSNMTISGALITDIQQFTNYNEVVSFVRTDSEQNRILGIYKEGEKGTTTIQTIDQSIDTINLALGNNWKGDWIAYTLDQRLFVLLGKHPSYTANPNGSTNNNGNGGPSLEVIAEHDLDFIPTTISASPTGRFVATASYDQLTTIDIEISQKYDYAFSLGTQINWFDDYLIWSNQDGTLVVVDFNGLNQRQLATEVSPFSIALTSNNRWLYFVTSETQTTPSTDPEIPDQTQTVHLLQRERL